jgi:hypothetical protein
MPARCGRQSALGYRPERVLDPRPVGYTAGANSSGRTQKVQTEQLSMSIAGDFKGGLVIAVRFADRSDAFSIDPDFPVSAAQFGAR